MLGRLHDEDARERSIRAMQRRYHVDVEQAQRVEATAAALLEQVQRGWELGDEHYRQLLVWAARLHEVGLDIAHARYHHHGGYLLANADMPGFVRLEQTAAGDARHSPPAQARRSVPRRTLPSTWRAPLFKLDRAAASRRAAEPDAQPRRSCRRSRSRRATISLEVRVPAGWLDDNPLTEADLEQETDVARGSRVRAAGGSATRGLRRFRRARAAACSCAGFGSVASAAARTARSGRPRAAPTLARCRAR